MIDIYGLIGKSLKHSFSKSYFEAKFQKENIKNCVYELFELNEINEIYHLLNRSEIKGLNVTIPYKTSVLPFCDIIDENALNIGAANVLFKNNGKLEAHNTDYIGFEKSLLPLLNPEIKNAMILGNGGAAKAIIYALQNLNINIIIVGRNEAVKYTDIDKSMIENHRLIINCTPLGTFPNEAEKPAIPYAFLNENHILYDLVYNPELTAFLKEGKAKNCTIKNGLEMLKIQAEASWKIWNKSLDFYF